MDSHACRLRRKLARAGAEGWVCSTWGVGYSLAPDFRTAALGRTAHDHPGTKGVHSMSTDSSPEQELAAFGQAVRELREQRGDEPGRPLPCGQIAERSQNVRAAY